MITWTPTPPRWVPCHATHIRGGDLVSVGKLEYRVVRRTFTPDSSLTFRVYLADGSHVPFHKSAVVRVFDPDGSVSARVAVLPDERHDAGARWVPCYGGDIEPGDLVDLHGTFVRVAERTRTPFFNPMFRVTLPDGSVRGVIKTARVRVFDPDGSVSRRVASTGGRDTTTGDAGEVDA